MAKRRMRFCPDPCPHDGIRYGNEALCKGCRADKNRRRNREAYRATHGVRLTCLMCGKPHGRHGTKARCDDCQREYQRKRLAAWRATWTPEQRARHAAYSKAYQAVGKQGALALMKEWM